MNKVLQDRLRMALLMVEDCLSAAHREGADIRNHLSDIHHDLSLLVVRGSDNHSVDPSRLLNVAEIDGSARG